MFGNTGVFGLSKISIPDESDVTQEHDKGKRLGLYKYREEEEKKREATSNISAFCFPRVSSLLIT